MSQFKYNRNIKPEFIVTRTIKLASITPDSNVLREIESKLANKLSLTFKKASGKLSMTYDSSAISFGLITHELLKAKIELSSSLWSRLTHSIYTHTDEVAASIAKSKTRPHCNMPPRNTIF